MHKIKSVLFKDDQLIIEMCIRTKINTLKGKWENLESTLYIYNVLFIIYNNIYIIVYVYMCICIHLYMYTYTIMYIFIIIYIIIKIMRHATKQENATQNANKDTN